MSYSENNDGSLKEEYHHLIARRLLILAISMAAIILIVGFLSLSVYDNISLKESYMVIWNHICGNSYDKVTEANYWWADRYIWNRVIPHALVAILAGASLAICGSLMQPVMNNPLADPYSTGISSGACFGAVAALIVGFSFSSSFGESGIVGNAFIGALIPAIIVIVLSEKIKMTPATLILTGTAISYFFNSMVTYMMVMADPDTIRDAYIWQTGSMDGMTWDSVPVMLVITIIGSIIIMYLSPKLNIMATGDNSAISMGVDVHKFRIFSLVIMAVMTAAVVSYTGIIGFIGLVAPHLVRLVIGSDNRYVIPISMAFGAALLLIADYIALTILSIPVGVIMGLIGSPVFFALIVWQNKRTGAIY